MAFATTEDVAVRLGRTLTDPEDDLVEQVIADVTGLIAEAVGKDAAWAAALDPVPSTFKALCVEKAIAVGSNPNGLAAKSESLGAFSTSETFRRDTGVGVFLTDDDERRVRFALHGSSTASTRQQSIVDVAIDLAEDGDFDLEDE